MNCKPGDLCIFVNAETDETKPFEGQIHRVDCIYDRHRGLAWWSFSPRVVDKDGYEVVWADEDLRPIRDPGDDAQDESLTWLPVPTKELA